MLTCSDLLALSRILGDRLRCERFDSFPAADCAAGLETAGRGEQEPCAGIARH